ncbi:hypothetical protein [Aliiglaciecola aliphaticivorans]
MMNIFKLTGFTSCLVILLTLFYSNDAKSNQVCNLYYGLYAKSLSQDMQFNYADHSSNMNKSNTLELIKQYKDNASRVISNLNKLIATNSSSPKMAPYKKIREHYYVISDMGTLGYAIIKAEMENDADLFVGLIKGLYTEKFKPLTFPLLNRAAIEYRKHQIRTVKIDEEENARKSVLSIYRSLYGSNGYLLPKYDPCY